MSLISLQHQFADKFLAGATEHVPIFVEAESVDWTRPQNVESVVQAVNTCCSSSDSAAILKGVAGNRLKLFVDGVDEAFPSVYQEMDAFDPRQLRLDIPHVMACRKDFFSRNLHTAAFCKQYDEILEMQPWTLGHEVPEFVEKYYRKIHATLDEQERAELLKVIGEFAGSPGMQLTPLVVTAIMFVWRYDSDQIVRNLPRTFASLIERFTRIWAERETSTGACVFRNADDLLRAYEEAAWCLYSGRTNRRPTIEELGIALSNKTGVQSRVLTEDRGLLSMLRTGRPGAGGQDAHVISFVHQAIYEYLLARRLADALRGKTTDTGIVGRLLGHSINRLARQLLSAPSDGERSTIVNHLERKYKVLRRTAYGAIGAVICCGRVIRYGRTKAVQRMKDDIVKRHNICYFWGRLESDVGGEAMRRLFAEIVNGSVPEHEMVCTTVGSSILLMNDARLERMYLDKLGADGAWDRCNRTYHRVYYGDAGYVDPDMFLKDEFQKGRDDWRKTRQAILTRLSSGEERAVKLRSLDLVTFRRLSQTRGVPQLNSGEIAVLENCARAPNGLSKERTAVLREEHEQLMALFRKKKRARGRKK